MNPQSIADYSYFFNNFATDTRPMYQAYNPSLDQNCFDDYKNQDYTILPKYTPFFDDYKYAPLDVTRQSTDFTDVSESASYSQKGISPGFRPISQEQGFSIPSMNAKSMETSNKNKFIAVLGTNTGFTFNTLQKRGKEAEHNSLGCTKNESSKSAESDTNDDESPNEQLDDNEQLKHSMDSQDWSEEHDNTLLKFASQYKCDWKRILKKFDESKINTQFLKSRYKELINAPLQRRIKFTHKEDLMIAKYFEKYGSNWAQMAAHFSDRTAVMLKNRYYSHIRKRDLLSNLTAEVHEIENDDQEIDHIKDHELDSKDNEKSEEAVFQEEVSFSGLSQNTMNISSSFEDRQEVSSSYDDASASEIQRLKEKVRCLQSLYLKTKMELNRIKAQGSN